MKTLLCTLAFLSTSLFAASPLDGSLACLRELLPRSRGEARASRRVPATYYTASHTEIFVYSDGHAAAYTLPERAFLTDEGDRAYFLQLPTADVNKPLLLSLLQTGGENFFDENQWPSIEDENKYVQPLALPDANGAEAERRLQADIEARLKDRPRFEAELARRFPKAPPFPPLAHCQTARALSSQKR